MSECFSPEVRDFLPDLVHGKLGEVDTATMLAHVEACEVCAAELVLLREIRASAPLVPSIDAGRIVASLPAPRVAPSVEVPRPASRSGAWKLLSLAAVIAVAAVAATQLDRGSVSTPVARVTQAPVIVEAVTPAATNAGGAPSLALVASVQDLTDDEIETLLTELDQIESIPSAEPEAASIGISSDIGVEQ